MPQRYAVRGEKEHFPIKLLKLKKKKQNKKKGATELECCHSETLTNEVEYKSEVK